MLLTPEQIGTAVAGTNWRGQRHPRCVAAAILLPLFNRDVQTHVLVIEKAQDRSRHAGQIAFPGGKIERSDASVISAALREAHEEINLLPQQVQVLGSMGYFRTLTSGFDAAVTLGWLPEDLPLMKNREVVNVFQVSLDAVLMDFHPSTKVWTRSGLLNLHFHVQPAGTSRTICIWGLTARILHHLLLALKPVRDEASHVERD